MRVRIRSSARSPAGVMRTRALRRSLASATRVTMPASARLATILVMVGGWTCSMAASSPRVGLPCLLTEPSAEAWAGERPPRDS